MLETIKVNVAPVEDGGEALRAVKDENYDCVFMDIEMPMKNGFETANELQQTNPELPMIALTAQGYDESKKHQHSNCFQGFLRKPESIDSLFKALKESVQ